MPNLLVFRKNNMVYQNFGMDFACKRLKAFCVLSTGDFRVKAKLTKEAVMLTEILIKYFVMFFWFMLYLSWGALRAEAGLLDSRVRGNDGGGAFRAEVGLLDFPRSRE